MNYYVLACETGREERNITLLLKTVKLIYPDAWIQAYSPQRESKEFCAKKWSMKKRSLLPGYIIAVCDKELWRIQKDIFLMSETCYGILKNIDGTYELHSSDLAFARWVEDNSGFIRASKVIIDESKLLPNDKITIVSGPMKDLTGHVVSIYKGVRCTVEVNFMNEVKRLILPIEIVERINSEKKEEKTGFTVLKPNEEEGEDSENGSEE